MLECGRVKQKAGLQRLATLVLVLRERQTISVLH